MRFDVITIFPSLIESYFQEGILSKSRNEGLIKINSVNLREFGLGGYSRVDHRVFGGGAGMVLMFEPMANAIEAAQEIQKKSGIKKTKIILTSAGGEIWDQVHAKKFISSNNNSYFKDYDQSEVGCIIICGRYEGIDQRVIDTFVDLEISMGKYILTGGELAALVMIDSIARMIPGVLGNEESFITDSFYEDPSYKQAPVYTRPEIITYKGKELKVPKTLLSGNHAEIEKWREENSR
jgi:tRNA (guanine37-N1)-methyltransferase